MSSIKMIKFDSNGFVFQQAGPKNKWKPSVQTYAAYALHGKA